MAYNLMDLRRRIIASQPHIVTKSGEIVTFSTPISIPLKSLILSLSPVQSGSGDPYPPGGSPQRWDEEWEDGVIGEDGSITPSTGRKTTSFIAVQPETEYYEVSPTSAYEGRIGFYDSSKGFISRDINGVSSSTKKFTTPANCYYVRITFGSGYGTTYNQDISINYPSTDHDYHAWKNERPISGHTSASVVGTGKNLFDKTVSCTEGKIRGDDGTETDSTQSKYTNPLKGFLPNTQYTIQGTLTASTLQFRIYYLDADKGWISRTSGISASQLPYTFTTPANCYYIEIQCHKTASDFDTVQIEKGSTVSTYEAFGTTNTVSWE